MRYAERNKIGFRIDHDAGKSSLTNFFGHSQRIANGIQAAEFRREGAPGDVDAFDSYEQVARAEWDTLLFFFGVIINRMLAG